MLWLTALAILTAETKTPEPKEFIALMEKSPREYRVESEEHPVAQWPQQNAMRAWPQLRDSLGTIEGRLRPDGTTDIVACGHEPEAEKLLEIAEPLFEAKKLKEAEAQYAKILTRFPNDYVVHLHYGDTALLDKRPKEALARYEAAAKTNPLDFHSWWYRGDALAALGRSKEALPFWIRALALRPRSPELRRDLEINLPRAGLSIRDPVFLPHARVEQAGDAIVLRTEVKPWWLAWAMCKAVWLGEPDFRKRMTGKTEHTFTMLEERQCLVNFAAAYGNRDKKKDGDDPIGEHVLKVGMDHLLDGLAAYEILPRALPDATATTDAKSRELVEKYIRKYVLDPPQP